MKIRILGANRASPRRIRAAVAAGLALLVVSAADAVPVIGGSVVVSTTGNVVATYRGNSAAYSNDLYLSSPLTFPGIIFNNHASPVNSSVNLGTFTAGTELIFRLHVNNTGRDYFTGPGYRNPDGFAHARVTSGWSPTETLVEFEDLFGGPFHYNDLSFSFTNVAATATPPQNAVPDAGSTLLSLLLSAAGIVAYARRRAAA